jgi:hypothetical protein
MAKTDVHRGWARLGAGARLAEIDSERAAILKAFPDLRRKGATAELSPSGRPKRRFSAAARRRMSAGMRKFWARRRAEGKVGKGKA